MVARVTTLTDTVRRRPPLVAARAASGAFARASAAGNRSLQIDSAARTTYAYDAANQTRYSQDGTGRTTFTFDNAGNQRIELSPALARTTNVWDYENRRRAAIDPSTGATTFTYRPDALRVKTQDGSSTTKFIWDEQRVLTETDDSNTAQVVYTSEPAGHGNLISQRRLSGGIWTPYVHLYDALGSTDRLTTSTESTAVTYVYSAFGQVVAQSAAHQNAYSFNAQAGYFCTAEMEYVAGLRVISPGTGRWLSSDFIQGVLGLRFYPYVENRPVVFYDSTGAWKATDLPGVYEAEEDPHDVTKSDTLEGLIRLVNPELARPRNSIACIRPIPVNGVLAKMQRYWDMPTPKPAQCGWYDVSNFAIQTIPNRPGGGSDVTNVSMVGGGVGEIAISVGYDGNFYIDLAGAFFGVPPQNQHLSATGAVAALRAASLAGREPLRKVTIIGHSDKNVKSIGGWTSFDVLGNDRLDIKDFGKDPWKYPDWTNAVAGNMPAGCWFGVRSEVRLVGCKTASMASQWANALARNTAAVLGTEAFTYASVQPSIGIGLPNILPQIAMGFVTGRPPRLKVLPGYALTPEAYFQMNKWVRSIGAN